MSGSWNIVEPVLGGPVLSGHTLLSSELSKSRKLLPLIALILTSIKWSRSPFAKSWRAVPIVLTCIKQSLCKRKPLKYLSSSYKHNWLAHQVIGNIDSSEPNWGNTTRDQLLVCEEDEAMTVSAERRLLIFNEREDEYDVELKQLTSYKVSIGGGEHGRATERFCSV